MPIFEYACLDCDHRFEMLVRGTATPECPSCHSVRLEKQLSVFAVASGSTGQGTARHAPSPCASCGDPRGPGACAYN